MIKDFFIKAFPFLSPAEITTVGLEWSDSEIRVVEVRKKTPKPELVHSFVGSFEDPLEMAVQKALALANISTHSVRIAVSGEGVVVRHLKLPPMKKEEIATALSFELEKYLPYKESEVILDFQVLGETKDKKMHILVAAVKRELIKGILEFLKKAQLEPTLIDVAGFAVCNAFLFNQVHSHSPEAVGIVHVTKELTTVHVIKDNICYFSRDISMGQSQVQSDPGLLGDLANEVRYTLDYYESQWDDTVKKTYLSGSLDLRHLDSLKKNVGMEVALWDPIGCFEVAPEIPKEELEKMKSLLHLVVGLAVRPL